MDWINVIAIIITLISIFVTLYTTTKHNIFLKSVIPNLKQVFNNLEALCYITEDGSKEGKATVHAKATATRNQVAGIIQSITNDGNRAETFDYGIDGQTIEEIARKRKEKIGIDFSGCIIQKQSIQSDDNEKNIESLMPGDIITSYDIINREKTLSSVTSIKRFHINNYLEINEVLRITANHNVYTKHAGWVKAAQLSIGDEIMKESGIFTPVTSLRLVNEKVLSYSISVAPFNNLYVNEFLVHNEEEK